MLPSLHQNRTTTRAIRAAIREAVGTIDEVSERFGMSRDAVIEWRHYQTTADRSHAPHRLSNRLNNGQEVLVLYLRTPRHLSLKDLLALLEFLSRHRQSSADSSPAALICQAYYLMSSRAPWAFEGS